MNIKNLLACALVSLIAVSPTGAYAGGLPEDTPVTYGTPEMEENVMKAPDQPQPAQDTMPELDESSVPEGTPHDSFTVDIGGGGTVGPGDKPKTNSFTIQTVSDLQFPTPYTPAIVDATNPETSTVISQYTLRVNVAELERQIGRTGYTDEQWQELSSQAGFDPETSYIVLAETKGIAPGSMVQEMTMGALPDGSMLGVGDYSAEMVVTAYDVVTNRKSMLGSVVEVEFHVLSEEIIINFDITGKGELHTFNPVTQSAEVKFAVMISQADLEAGCGSPHRTVEELAIQAANPLFDPAYEWLTLYESESVAPGAYLNETVQLLPLPDAMMMPEGYYTAWLARYTYDDSLQLWQLLDAKTQLKLVVGNPILPEETPVSEEALTP